jgi:hypothetical protein
MWNFMVIASEDQPLNTRSADLRSELRSVFKIGPYTKLVTSSDHRFESDSIVLELYLANQIAKFPSLQRG